MDLSGLAFRTFSHATEDEGKVKEALAFACGCDDVTTEDTSGYHGNSIKVIEARISGKKVNEFFKRLEKEDLRQLLDSIEKRVDEESFFFLRLDKQLAYQKTLRLSEGDDVIAVRGKIKSYPKKRENSVKIITQYLHRLIESKDKPRAR